MVEDEEARAGVEAAAATIALLSPSRLFLFSLESLLTMGHLSNIITLSATEPPNLFGG